MEASKTKTEQDTTTLCCSDLDLAEKLGTHLSAKDDYPEGGKEAILTLVGAFMVNFITLGMTAIIGVLEVEYSERELKGMQEFHIAWIGTVQAFMAFFIDAFVGRLCDTFGPTPFIIARAITMPFGLFMVSLSTHYYQFLLSQGVAVGLGSALVNSPALDCVAHWYSRKRATAMGIVPAGAALGSVVLPIALNNLIETFGFDMGVRAVACVSFVVMVPPVFMIKARLPARKFDGWRSLVDIGGLRDPRYTLVLVGSLVTGFGINNPICFAQLFSVLKGHSKQVSSYIVAVMNAGSFIGRVAVGLMADRFGAMNMMAPWCTISATILICWIFVHDSCGLVIWAIVYGIFSGAFVSLQPTCIANFTPDMTTFGGRVGLAIASDSLAALVSGPVAGALFDLEHEQFHYLIIFSGISCFLGALFFWAANYVGWSRVQEAKRLESPSQGGTL